MYEKMPFRCDAVSATLRMDSTTLRTFLSSWDRTFVYTGTMDDPWKNRVLNMHADYYDPFSAFAKQHTAEYEYDYATSRYRELKGGGSYINLYLKNVRKIGPSELLGFLHVEYIFQDAKNPYPCYYSIALCHSVNNGDHWTFCGDIIRTNNTHADDRCNIGGAAYIVKDGCYYVYFNEVDEGYNIVPSVARADTGSVNVAARKGQVTQWKKYTGNNEWDAVACSKNPGLGVKIIPDSILPCVDMHADAAYCGYIRKYLLALKACNNLYMLSSPDGINWSNPRRIASYHNGTLRSPTYPYFASLSPDASDDCSVVGREFSIYFINMLFDPASGNNLELCRIKMLAAQGKQ